MRFDRRAYAALAVFAALLFAATARADSTVTVSRQCTLPDAVAYADGTAESGCASGTASGTTTIVVPAGMYTLTSTLEISANTTISGAGASSTKISGGGVVEQLDITGGTVTISDVTLTDGSAGTPSDCTGPIENRTCQPENGNNGGAISNAGKLTLQSDVISHNAAGAGTELTAQTPCSTGCAGSNGGNGGSGGAMYNTGTLTVTDSTIDYNNAGAAGNGTGGTTSQTGGGGPGQNGGRGGQGGAGGAIANVSQGSITITNSMIADNSAGAAGNGGAGSNANESGAEGGDGGAAGAGGAGGAIESFVGTYVDISGSTLAENTSGAGGNGAAAGSGDGASNGDRSYGGDGGSGGAIFDQPSLPMRGPPPLESFMSEDTVTGNTAAAGGTPGGAGGIGGGVDEVGELMLAFTTVADNAASADGSQLTAGPGAINESFSIVAAGSASTVASCNSPSTIAGSGDIDFDDDSGASCPGANVDPKLGPLADNGGPTETMALGAGSAAIGVANPVANCAGVPDQRGVARPQAGECDPGAYEWAPPVITSPVASATSAATGSVSASINPNLSAHDTMVTVEYGTTSAYGSSTTAQDIGDGSSPVAFSASLTGLQPSTTYDVEIVATNGDGTSTVTAGTLTTKPRAVVSIVSASTSGTALRLKLSCRGAFGGSCDGPVALSARGLTVGTSSYSFAAGSTTTVRVGLNSAGTRTLAEHYRLTVSIALGGVSQRIGATFSYARIRAKVGAVWSGRAVKKLVVSAIPRGASVAVVCHGGGCPFERGTFASHRGRASLTAAFKGRMLSPGATLTVEVTARNEVGYVAVFTIRGGRRPKVGHSCLPPGAKGAVTCA